MGEALRAALGHRSAEEHHALSAIKCNQVQSSAIKCNQVQSPAEEHHELAQREAHPVGRLAQRRDAVHGRRRRLSGLFVGGARVGAVSGG